MRITYACCGCVHNIFRPSVVCLFFSSGAIVFCFHMEIHTSVYRNGSVSYELRRKRTTKNMQTKHVKRLFLQQYCCAKQS